MIDTHCHQNALDTPLKRRHTYVRASRADRISDYGSDLRFRPRAAAHRTPRQASRGAGVIGVRVRHTMTGTRGEASSLPVADERSESPLERSRMSVATRDSETEFARLDRKNDVDHDPRNQSCFMRWFMRCDALCQTRDERGTEKGKRSGPSQLTRLRSHWEACEAWTLVGSWRCATTACGRLRLRPKSPLVAFEELQKVLVKRAWACTKIGRTSGEE